MKTIIRTEDGKLIQFDMELAEVEQLDKQIKTLKKLLKEQRDKK
jgi:hypothetical protein